jgi:cell division protein FtsI (penicillin-binding protein 3)
MASTIANGGIYLAPHILLESTDDVKGSAKLKPATFHPESELPDPLPQGAHRVISEMTAAEMRKMMEGVVLFGTASRTAQLNGYSAAGKTGTAEKIDPATRTYSKTKFVASFVGFAPVNNPAITIAVIMDSPSYQFHFGTAASAPVFQDLAQQILEYLGVPHDQEMKPAKLVAKNDKAPAEDDAPQENPDDLNSLFAEVNHLPADDPLRANTNDAGKNDAAAQTPETTSASADIAAPAPVTKPDADVAQKQTATAPVPVAAAAAPQETQQAKIAPPSAPAPVLAKGSVSVANKRIAVPSFVGESVRQVVVQAGSAGLGVQVLGWGIARNQAPAPGTMVPAGTDVVVRFSQQPPAPPPAPQPSAAR